MPDVSSGLPIQMPALRPPALPLLKGCGYLLAAGAIVSLVSIVFAFFSAQFDVGSLLALIAILHWRTIVRNMKRLHEHTTLLENSEDAEDSTYRSKSIEYAFRVTAFYLPLLVVVLTILKGLFQDDAAAFVTLVTGSPVFLGIFILPWRRKFRALRFQQVQNARDELADVLIDVASDASTQSSHPLEGRAFFLYLRPFSSTGRLLAVPKDAVIRAAIDLETRLADAVAYWGPLVALGRPGEARGAGRKLVSEREWKLAIELSGPLASTIFVLPSIEEGITWEIGLLQRNLWLDRTVFVQPPQTPQFTSEWWQATRRLLQTQALAAPEELHQDRMALFTLLEDGSIDRIEHLSTTAGISTIRQALVRLGE